jgi:hypothetical protein
VTETFFPPRHLTGHTGLDGEARIGQNRASTGKEVDGELHKTYATGMARVDSKHPCRGEPGGQHYESGK